MNEELIAHQLKIHEERLNGHSKRLDDVEKDNAASNVKIDNLCEKLELQTKSINWLVGLMATGLLGFFFYSIQTDIFGR